MLQLEACGQFLRQNFCHINKLKHPQPHTTDECWHVLELAYGDSAFTSISTFIKLVKSFTDFAPTVTALLANAIGLFS